MPCTDICMLMRVRAGVLQLTWMFAEQRTNKGLKVSHISVAPDCLNQDYDDVVLILYSWKNTVCKMYLDNFNCIIKGV